MRGYRLKCWLFNFYMTSQEASGRLPAVRWKKYRSGIRFMVKPPLHQHQIVFTCVCQVAEQFFETLQHSWRIKLNVLIWSRTLNLWRPPCCRTVLPFSNIWTSCCLSQPYIYIFCNHWIPQILLNGQMCLHPTWMRCQETLRESSRNPQLPKIIEPIWSHGIPRAPFTWGFQPFVETQRW